MGSRSEKAKRLYGTYVRYALYKATLVRRDHTTVSAAWFANGLCAPGIIKRLQKSGRFLPLVPVISSVRTKTDCILLLPAILMSAAFQPDAKSKLVADDFIESPYRTIAVSPIWSDERQEEFYRFSCWCFRDDIEKSDISQQLWIPIKCLPGDENHRTGLRHDAQDRWEYSCRIQKGPKRLRLVCLYSVMLKTNVGYSGI